VQFQQTDIFSGFLLVFCWFSGFGGFLVFCSSVFKLLVIVLNYFLKHLSF